MAGKNEAEDLESMLDQLDEAGSGSGSISAGELVDTVGQRSFGPWLLIPALIALTPIGAIPGLPTMLALIVILIAGQLVIGQKRFWLPELIRERDIERQRLRNGVGYLRPAARMVDKVLQPRLTWLTKGPFVPIAAALCVAVALTVPPLEVLPFAGMVSWAAIAAFGLALIAHDGALALIALAFTAGAAAAVLFALI
jgi:hypothetical protein